ncbi:MAG: hypothetical protein KAI72_03275, partial [Candidatus Pacebacteria bacterium]|nr:hypothetical protein [Candidatus Paceibacterota bacterium]
TSSGICGGGSFTKRSKIPNSTEFSDVFVATLVLPAKTPALNETTIINIAEKAIKVCEYF